MKKYAIIVAGGSGTRMGTEIPKQFLELKGKPVLMHSMKRFFNFDPNITLIVVLPQQQIKYWENLCEIHHFNIPHTIVVGGSERFYSVKNGLSVIKENALVAIHDAVRPMVSSTTIKKAFDAAHNFGNGIPSVAVHDSLRKVEGEQNFAVMRNQYKIIQTPQCFASSIIMEAFKQDYSSGFTDDASVIESVGLKVHLTEGNLENIKITSPVDLKMAETLIDGIH